MHFRTRLAALAAGLLALGLGGAVLAAPTAHAATDLSFNTPIHGGLLLNASAWGGTSSKAATLAGGTGVVNDAIDVWLPASASVASDFVKIPVTFATTDTHDAGLCTSTVSGATGCFLIEYAPGNELSGKCVSTVTDVQGAFARLRGCAAAVQDGGTGTGHGPVNQWQDFAETNGGDGLSELQAVLETTCGPSSTQGCVLNVKGFGGKGAQVISWPSATGTMGSENQLWEEVAAAA